MIYFQKSIRSSPRLSCACARPRRRRRSPLSTGYLWGRGSRARQLGGFCGDCVVFECLWCIIRWGMIYTFVAILFDICVFLEVAADCATLTAIRIEKRPSRKKLYHTPGLIFGGTP
jgi:hypothetical protein